MKQKTEAKLSTEGSAKSQFAPELLLGRTLSTCLMETSKEPVKLELDNQYIGYEPPPGKVTAIDRISPHISPKLFFEKYVAQRRPVIIEGHLTDPKCEMDHWTNRYLQDKAGDAEVIVEQRGDHKAATFGLMAPKINMKYSEFVANVVKRNGRLYLTTQDLERFEDDLDEYDMPRSVIAEPLKSLQGDFPVQPELLGNLIPYQLSLWQGIAKNGTSSGLHHDYHDNLYVLVRGRKRFRLFAPSAAPHMETAGILAKIHTNGLIVYRNKPDDPIIPVRSDGVPMSFMARKKKEQAEEDLTRVEEALDDLTSSGLPEVEKTRERLRLEKLMDECEERIDQAMEEVLEYGCPGDVDSNDDSDADESGLFQKEDNTKGSRSPKSENGEPKAKKQRTGDAADCDASGEPEAESASNVTDAVVTQEERPKMPDHFCDMNFEGACDSPEKFFTDFPHLQKVGCMITEIQAGEMLYLPASWFHEVTSYTETLELDSASVVHSSQDQGHLAFNYWMYPPDNVQFEQPYKDDFWPSRWAAILRDNARRREWHQQDNQIHIHSGESDSDDDL